MPEKKNVFDELKDDFDKSVEHEADAINVDASEEDSDLLAKNLEDSKK